MADHSSGVTIIVNCFNSEKLIVSTLKHIQAQENPNCPWEVIVIDDNSKDKTSEVITEVWNENEVTDFKLIKELGIGKVQCIFNALKKAKYEYISIVDDDNRIEKNWVQKVFDFFEGNPKYGVMGSRSEGEFDSEPPFWFKRFSKNYAIGSPVDQSRDITDKGWVWGAGSNIRKSAVEKLFELGWEPLIDGPVGRKRVGGEDVELCYAIRILGYKVFFNNELLFKHYMPKDRLRWDYLINMKKVAGRSKMYLDIYRFIYQLSKHEISDLPGANQLIWNKVKELLSNLKSVIKSLIKREEGDAFYLHLQHSYEYINILVKNKNEYYDGCQRMLLFNQKVNSI